MDLCWAPPFEDQSFNPRHHYIVTNKHNIRKPSVAIRLTVGPERAEIIEAKYEDWISNDEYDLSVYPFRPDSDWNFAATQHEGLLTEDQSRSWRIGPGDHVDPPRTSRWPRREAAQHASAPERHCLNDPLENRSI